MRELKQRLVTKDDISKGEHQMHMAQKTKDVEDMKRENQLITKRYQGMAELLKQKELSMLEFEDKSKKMLLAA